MEGIEYHNGKRVRKQSTRYGEEYAKSAANIKQTKANAAVAAQAKKVEIAAKRAEKETSELTKMMGSLQMKGGRRRARRTSKRTMRKRKTMRRK
jgi:hypothetical protein